MNSKNKSIAGIICVVFGSIAILISIIFFGVDLIMNYTLNRVGDKTLTGQTQGEIYNLVDADNKTYGLVKYTVDGKDYSVRTTWSSDTMLVGDNLAVHFNPQKPQRSSVEPPKVIGLIVRVFLYIGIIGGVIGIGLVITAICLFTSAKKLKQSDFNSDSE